MYKEQVITENDLKQINRYTLKEMTVDDVAVFTMKIIDSHPTSNNRVWTKEWMMEAIKRKLFDGIPFLTDHENSQTTKIGTIFSAELREDGIYGKVFLPLDTQGKQAKKAIENGRITSVSINADGQSKEIDGKIHILPSPEMRVYEVSAVAVAGCKSCKITECHENETPTESAELIYANETLTNARLAFVRLCGFTFGTNNRELYSKVADSLDPFTLTAFSKDIQKSYEERNKVETEALQESSSDVTADIRKAIQSIKHTKGV
ncbi:hypothetical protein C4585_01555 [Candidatus Parcubacteria bacterium]|nr:MAG: hypothetical protein C4585_01555 [Candidatus Parcubacteria bacterium]